MSPVVASTISLYSAFSYSTFCPLKVNSAARAAGANASKAVARHAQTANPYARCTRAMRVMRDHIITSGIISHLELSRQVPRRGEEWGSGILSASGWREEWGSGILSASDWRGEGGSGILSAS